MRKILTIIALFLAIPAFAAQINGNNQDLDTATVGVSGNSINWSKRYSVNQDQLDKGQTITLAAYYHNSSKEVLDGLRVTVDNQNSGPLKKHEFSVRFTANNAKADEGKAVIDFTEPVILEIENVRWAPKQCAGCSEPFINDQDKFALFEPRGILLGNMQTGWEDQGNVLVTFKAKKVPEALDLSLEQKTGGCAVISSTIDPKEVESGLEYYFEYKKGLFGVTKTTNTKVFSQTETGLVSETICGIDENEEFYYNFVLNYEPTGGNISIDRESHVYIERPIFELDGEVALCDPYLTEYMTVGHDNKVEVEKLQTFLNQYEGENLHVTGIF